MEQILDLINNIGNGEGFDDILAAVAAIFGLFKGGQKAKQKHAERKGKPGELAALKQQIDDADVSIEKLWQERNKMLVAIEDAKASAAEAEKLAAKAEKATDPKLRTWSGQA